MREKVDNGKLTAADFEEATFSISSVGNIGGTYFVPTILRPQVAIMAIGKARKIAKYVEDATLADGYKFIPSDVVSFKFNNFIIDQYQYLCRSQNIRRSYRRSFLFQNEGTSRKS
jgi:pyruvate/2-oxoglutarate dehydrogenase complex dihydrolipoamide acyltransferase (E2) component